MLPPVHVLPFVHPLSHAPLQRGDGGYRCARSGDFFPDQAGRPCFVPMSMRGHVEEERGDFVNRVKTWLRRYPRLYRALIYWISPVCYVGTTAPHFLQRFPRDARVLNVGSGVHRYSPQMVNLDIFPYREVDVVGDATALPFADNTFDAAISECLIEHVPNPGKVVSEILRVLKPSGQAYIVAPFIYPFHACPSDFYRWSQTGLRALCRDAEIETVSPRAGPTSALVAQLVTWLSITLSFGSTGLYHILSMALLIPLAPLKFLDLAIGRFPTALHGAEGFYAIIRKTEKAAV